MSQRPSIRFHIGVKMAAITHKTFFNAYSDFIISIFNQLNTLPIYKNRSTLKDLKNELLSKEAQIEFMQQLSAKSIRENAALVILCDEYSDVARSLQREPIDNLPSLVAETNEVLGSTKEIFGGLPSWLKASIKVLQETLNLSIPRVKRWKDKKRKVSSKHSKYM